MNEVTLRIDGMHCGACIRRVTQALQAPSLQAPSSVEVEEVRLGAARVRLDKSANAEELISRLAKAGFPAQVEK